MGVRVLREGKRTPKQDREENRPGFQSGFPLRQR
jgi:hypothetical protein